MRYTLFDNYNSADLGLIYLNKTIGAPTLKASTVEIAGADGVLDLSEFFGLHYGNRLLTMSFASIVRPYSERIAIDSAVKNALHGKQMHVIFDDDPEFYYVARITVGDWYNDEGYGLLPIYGDAEPWKYRVQDTVVSQAGNGTASLQNLRMPVTPRITTTAETTLTWSGYSVALPAGADQLVPALTLGAGTTEVTIETTGTVTFSYREGGF